MSSPFKPLANIPCDTYKSIGVCGNACLSLAPKAKNVPPASTRSSITSSLVGFSTPSVTTTVFDNLPVAVSLVLRAGITGRLKCEAIELTFL